MSYTFDKMDDREGAAARSPSQTAKQLKEHAALSALLAKIPKKAQRGLMTQVDIKLTCVDANKSFIALGSNVGLVFLYDRATETLERLKCESYKTVVTVVKLHEGVEHQVALGTTSGLVYMFQLPSKRPRQSKQAQLQKFSLDLHKSAVTCLHWSTNGMKLFSGSATGLVVSTEVDFYEGQCKSEDIVKENAPIVQLDYTQRTLLVSTTARSLICKTDQNDQVIQVGQTERKMPGRFGACFTAGLSKADTFVFAARPNQRLWKADFSGQVQQTLLFKDLLSSVHPEIPLLTYSSDSSLTVSQCQFQTVKLLKENRLLTWGDRYIVILDPLHNYVVASQCQMGEIVDVAVSVDEVFVLQNDSERSLIRLAENPDESKAEGLGSSPVPSPLPSGLSWGAGVAKKNLTSEGQESGKRSPLKFLQKNIIDKLKMHHEGELAVPLGVELESDKPSMSTSTVWGLEKETEPRLLEFSSASPTNSHSSGSLISPKPQHIAQQRSTVSVSSGEDLTSDLPPIITLDSSDTLRVHVYQSGSQTVPTEPTPVENQVQKTLAAKSSSASKEVKPDDESPRRRDNHNQSGASMSSLFANIKDTPASEIVFSKSKGKKVKKKLKRGKEKGVTTDSHVEETDMSKVAHDQGLASGGSEVSLTDVGETTKEISANPRSPEASTTRGKVTRDSSLTENGDKPTEKQDNNLKVGIHKVESQLKETVTLDVKSQDAVHDSDSQHSITDNPAISDERKPTKCDSDLQVKSDVKLNSVSDKEKNSLDNIKNDPGVPNTPKEQSDLQVNTGSNVDSIPTSQPKSSVLPEGRIKDASDSLVQDQLHQGAVALNIQGRQQTVDIYDTYNCWHNTLSGSATEETLEQREVNTRAGASEDNTSKDILKDLPVFNPRPTQTSTPEFTDTWAKFPTPGIVQSLSVSNTHAWICDSDEYIYCSSLMGPGINWKQVNVQGKQIAVSPNGSIVWRVHRNKAYAASKVSAQKPDGSKWIEAVRDVSCVAVDDTCAWCVKTNGDVKVQGDLRADRPTNKMKSIPCDHNLRQIACFNGVVWAVTDRCQLVARAEVSEAQPFGTHWKLEYSRPTHMNCLAVSLGPHNIGWVLDVQERIWFCTNVTTAQPFGDQKWWQVSLSEFVMHNSTAVDRLKKFAGKLDPQKFLRDISRYHSGCIAGTGNGTWVSSSHEKCVHVCNTDMVGHHWEETQPLGMASSTCWKLACAAVSHLPYGSVWAQQPNGELFAFPPHSFNFTKVEKPSLTTSFCHLSICPDAAWALTESGHIFIRMGMGIHCPLGATWVQQDLAQIGEAQIMNISCGSETVWAVGAEGQVFQRLGVKCASSYQLNPAWLPISSDGLHLTQVETGPEDCMVWALDNHKQVYARLGVTENMPIGREWVQVPGVLATQLRLSTQNVWALGLTGELFCRRGVQESNPVGDYWQKIPTQCNLVCLSVSANDDLWGINEESKLYRCTTQLLPRPKTAVTRQVSRSVSSADEGEWEFV